VRRSEPVKEDLLIEERVYPGVAQGTIGLRVQNRFNAGKYRCTRTGVEKGEAIVERGRARWLDGKRASHRVFQERATLLF